ncbi:hypothetical protein DV736_g2856, partial [Chaetothyriales sp. CBS 134916]
MADNASDQTPDDENPPDNQPDFERISEAHLTLYEEASKFPNLPAMDNGRALLNAIQDLTREVRQGFAKMSNLDRNNAARVQNTYVVSSAETLSPFINPETGDEIDGFPATSAEIRQMSPQQLGALLRALGLDAAGARPAKERRLREYIGLRRRRPEPA